MTDFKKTGYRYQLSSEKFNFNIITESNGFQRYQKYAEKHGLVRDICDPSLHDTEKVPIENFLNIEQKSPTWFRYRAQSDGTASSVGKKLKGPTMYPTIEQVSEAWMDALTKKPFEVTHTMAGHMKWGVGYEDPALVHFATDNKLAVAAVGTIYLPLSYILELSQSYVPHLKSHCDYLNKVCPSTTHYLVSPDGLVGFPDDGNSNELPTELIGMLEIKCASPFHHVEEEDGTLSWVDDMEKRQWFHPGEIPFVYVVQICLQAISGLYRLDMNDNHTMWFIRWTPLGFSEFKINFRPLVKMGIIATMLYFRLKKRLDLDSLPIVYTKEEQELSNELYRVYQEVMNGMIHRYVNHNNLYPEFKIYYECTKYHHFVVQEQATSGSE